MCVFLRDGGPARLCNVAAQACGGSGREKPGSRPIRQCSWDITDRSTARHGRHRWLVGRLLDVLSQLDSSQSGSNFHQRARTSLCSRFRDALSGVPQGWVVDHVSRLPCVRGADRSARHRIAVSGCVGRYARSLGLRGFRRRAGCVMESLRDRRLMAAPGNGYSSPRWSAAKAEPTAAEPKVRGSCHDADNSTRADGKARRHPSTVIEHPVQAAAGRALNSWWRMTNQDYTGNRGR